MRRKVNEVIAVVGIDPNSHKLALVESRRSAKKKAFLHTFDLTKADYEERCSIAFEAIYMFSLGCEQRDDVAPRFYLEAPVMGKGGPGATIPQAYVEGAVMAAAAQAGAEIHLVNNSTWKKRILGNGNINKKDIADKMKDIWPNFYFKVPIINDTSVTPEWRGKPDQDLIDAGAINLFGWNQVELMERISARRKKSHAH
jgi:Holliday junction resolvasome RuvABC endonuclease subunit